MIILASKKYGLFKDFIYLLSQGQGSFHTVASQTWTSGDFCCQNCNIMVLQALLSLSSTGRYPYDQWAHPLQHASYPVSTVSEVRHTVGTHGSDLSWGQLHQVLWLWDILQAQSSGDAPSHFWCQWAEVLLWTSVELGLDLLCSRIMSLPRLG